MQTVSPLVEYPEDMADSTVLAEAFLQVMGLNEAEAQRLARDIDWTSTLLLPLPENTVTSQEIMINGVSGMALQDIDSISSAIIWEKDGIIYLLQGKRSPTINSSPTSRRNSATLKAEWPQIWKTLQRRSIL